MFLLTYKRIALRNGGQGLRFSSDTSALGHGALSLSPDRGAEQCLLMGLSGGAEGMMCRSLQLCVAQGACLGFISGG